MEKKKKFHTSDADTDTSEMDFDSKWFCEMVLICDISTVNVHTTITVHTEP
jgi:hypothetical protein